jgi:hypothetical protein
MVTLRSPCSHRQGADIGAATIWTGQLYTWHVLGVTLRPLRPVIGADIDVDYNGWTAYTGYRRNGPIEVAWLS